MDEIELKHTPDGSMSIPVGYPNGWASAIVFHFPDGEVRLEKCSDMAEIVRRWNAFPALVEALKLARDMNVWSDDDLGAVIREAEKALKLAGEVEP